MSLEIEGKEGEGTLTRRIVEQHRHVSGGKEEDVGLCGLLFL